MLLRIITLTLLLIFSLGSSARAQNELKIENSILSVLDEREIPVLASGKLEHVYVREGAIVKSGQLIAEIESTKTKLNTRKLQRELEVARQEASSTVDLEYSQRTIEVAQLELSRAYRANERSAGAVPSSELDQLRLVLDKSQAEKKKVEFGRSMLDQRTKIKEIELELGKQELRDHKVVSPIGGMIVEMFRKKGEWAEVSQPVARVVRLDRLKSEIQIPAESEIRELIGSTGRFVAKLERLKNKEFPAKIILVRPEANPVTSTISVWVEIENDGFQLVPGLEGTVTLENIKTDSSESDPTNDIINVK